MSDTVKYKRKSGIESWGGWPSDVRDILWTWNHGRDHRLTFGRVGATTLFRCAGCDEWCEPAGNGVACLDGRQLCDPCLIVVARWENPS